MSAKKTKFIVLAVGDKDSYGYDEHSLPHLVHIIDSSVPDARQLTPVGVVAYYIHSSRATAKIANVLSEVESLRNSDRRFETLGIGLAYGQMVADFDWLGRLKRDTVPMGEVVSRAWKSIQGEQTYRKTFAELHSSTA